MYNVMSHSVFDNYVLTYLPHTDQFYSDHNTLHTDLDRSFNVYTSTAPPYWWFDNSHNADFYYVYIHNFPQNTL